VTPTMTTWDPDTYLRYAGERSRPFLDLIARIDVPVAAVRRVVDLGCGPGQLTATLTERWPRANVVGVDSSAEMVERASQFANDRLTFERGRVEDWAPDRPVDVIVSNATLQWVPDHRRLFARWVETLRPHGCLAFQVPGNFDQPSHTILRDLAHESPYAEHAAAFELRPVVDAVTYLADLTALGCRVDAWETTYVHVLRGEDAVFGWISGTGARPVLQALSDELRPSFEREYKARLRDAYPPTRHGTVLPFRRIFVVAQAPGEDGAA